MDQTIVCTGADKDDVRVSNLVSIIMPVYNAEDFIAGAVRSVQQQTYQDWELLVIDDCSRDGTARIVQAEAGTDPRIRILRQECNRGTASARNRGLGEARGRYIAFLDSDDRWMPEKLAKQIAFMKSTGALFSFTSIHRDRSSLGRRSYIAIAPQRVSYRDLLKSNPITCSSVVLDTRFLGSSRMPVIPRNEDFCFWLQLLKKSKSSYAHGLTEVCGVYTVRRDSVSSRKVASARELWRIYRKTEELGVVATLYFFAHFTFRWVKNRTG